MAVRLKIFSYLFAARIAIKLQTLLQDYTKKIAK